MKEGVIITCKTYFKLTLALIGGLNVDFRFRKPQLLTWIVWLYKARVTNKKYTFWLHFHHIWFWCMPNILALNIVFTVSFVKNTSHFRTLTTFSDYFKKMFRRYRVKHETFHPFCLEHATHRRQKYHITAVSCFRVEFHTTYLSDNTFAWV